MEYAGSRRLACLSNPGRFVVYGILNDPFFLGRVSISHSSASGFCICIAISFFVLNS